MLQPTLGLVSKSGQRPRDPGLVTGVSGDPWVLQYLTSSRPTRVTRVRRGGAATGLKLFLTSAVEAGGMTPVWILFPGRYCGGKKHQNRRKNRESARVLKNVGGKKGKRGRTGERGEGRELRPKSSPRSRALSKTRNKTNAFPHLCGGQDF
jgi:hypothetical protein